MHSFLLQDWLTIRGAPTISSIAQSEVDYLDMRPFQDVVFSTDIRAATSGGASALVLNFETAPVKEDGLFVGMISPRNIVSSVSPLPSIDKALLVGATTPVARWLRWRVSQTSASSAWEVTFRIWVSAGLAGR